MGALLTVLLLVPRPTLSGPEQLLDTADGVFRVHYTTVGADAPVHGADVAPQNGVPDDVDAVAAGLQAVISRWVVAAGMRPPLPDGGQGGDTRIDAYLRQLGGPRGNTVPEPVPGVTVGTSAWIELEPRTALVGAARLAAAAGHEAHHAIQFAYGPAIARWMQEASATYAEVSGFSGGGLDREIEQHWAAILTHPEVPLDIVDGVHEYDELVFAKFLRDRGGGDQALSAAWTKMADAGETLVGIETATGRSVADLLVEFASWNLSACDPPTASRYAPEGRCAQPHAAARFGVGAVPSTVSVPLPPLSTAWVNVPVDACAPVVASIADAQGVSWMNGIGDVRAAAEGDSCELAAGTPLIVARGPGGLPSVMLHLESSGGGAGCTQPGAAGLPDSGAGGAGCRLASPLRRAGRTPAVLALFVVILRLRRIRRAGRP